MVVFFGMTIAVNSTVKNITLEICIKYLRHMKLFVGSRYRDSLCTLLSEYKSRCCLPQDFSHSLYCCDFGHEFEPSDPSNHGGTFQWGWLTT
jgi:hypothetical protein